MFNLKDIKEGMSYQYVRNEIIKTDSLVIGELPVFCMSDYEVAENLKTKEKVYIRVDHEHDMISDVTTDIRIAVDCEKANQMVDAILRANGI